MSIKQILIPAAALALSLFGQTASGEPATQNYRPANASESAAQPVSSRDDEGVRRKRLRYRHGGYPAAHWEGESRWPRRNDGPPYGRCFMKCINSGHPADFCRTVPFHFCY
jgi:hypothetical protein